MTAGYQPDGGYEPALSRLSTGSLPVISRLSAFLEVDFAGI